MIIDAPSRQQLPALGILWQEAFGDTEAFWDTFTATAMATRRCFTATQDGQVMGALYWFDCDCRGQRLAYLYGVATAKAFRGQGVCHALMAHVHAHLQKSGYAGTVLVPGEESLFRFYEKMGYEAFCGMTPFSCVPDGNAVQLCPASTGEYARLRQQLLPEGGVVQEKENLAFLSAQAKLYMGPGFVLAARREGQRLLGLELLGDKTAAPGILTALGCAEGTFRVFGEGAPFAMYRPLNGAPAPTYFALAFD